MTLTDRLLEKDRIPDFLIRNRIRLLLAKRIQQETQPSAELQQAHLMRTIEIMKQSPVALETKKVNEQHYEVPTEFFQKVLGSRMKYSSCYWDDTCKSLEEAEEASLQITCSHADLQNGQEILELGCGWGSLTLYMAEHFPGAKITGVSNSATQKIHIDTVCKEKGFMNVQIITADMNTFSSAEKFDRVVSVEMFEHMRNYQKLLEKINGVLKEDGKLFVHIFTHKDFTYFFEDQDDTDWMSRYFFTGGIMPSDDLLFYFTDHFQVKEHWHWDGTHYQKTSEAWLKKMDGQKNEIIPVLKKTYGETEATKWWVYWRIFFMSCAELWGYRNGREWMVTHYLMEKIR